MAGNCLSGTVQLVTYMTLKFLFFFGCNSIGLGTCYVLRSIENDWSCLHKFCHPHAKFGHRRLFLDSVMGIMWKLDARVIFRDACLFFLFL